MLHSSFEKLIANSVRTGSEFTINDTWRWGSWEILEDSSKLEETPWNFVVIQSGDTYQGCAHRSVDSFLVSQRQMVRTAPAVIQTK